MKLRRRAVCALMAVLLALLPAGCREKGVQVVDGAGETVNLRFLGFKVGADKVEEIDGILNRYMEQNEDVVIVYEGLGDDFVDILTNRLENGYADDLFMISDQALTTYETRGWYGTLTPTFREDFVQRYSPIIQQLITVDGKIGGAHVPERRGDARQYGRAARLRDRGCPAPLTSGCGTWRSSATMATRRWSTIRATPRASPF
ncbi:MAG: hypothetical protein ACLVL7_08390 [Anaerotruncus massiliensis (ex Togo et al. 2019)]